jgi:hypothetical protein
MKFKSLLEARRNPDKNIKISAYDELKVFKDDPDIYISFRNINKIGINPKSRFNTPNGIYTYPLREIWKEIESKRNMDNIPWAGLEEYIYIVRSLNKPIFIKDLYKDYSSADFDRDIKKLKSMKFNNFDDILKDALITSKINSPVGYFWNLTRLLSLSKGNEFSSIKSIKTGAQAWNNLFRKLGYTGFADKSGKGVIHESEPTQAVFLSKDAFKVEKAVLNKNYFSFTLTEVLRKINFDNYELNYPKFVKDLLVLLHKENKTIIDKFPELNNRSILQIAEINSSTSLTLMNQIQNNTKLYKFYTNVKMLEKMIDYLISIRKPYSIINILNLVGGSIDLNKLKFLEKYKGNKEVELILKNYYRITI